MAERDPLILEYSHLRQLPREKDALHSLKKIASLVKPIMRARNWKVGTLAEFYPDQQNLLGLNVNKGQKICLRLRYPGDKNQFLPFEQVVDTMLHELSHNVHGPHNADFHALWEQLRKEHEALQAKGYSGEGFLSEGQKLGGRRVPRDEARRIARAAAEKRRTLYSGSGQKLGGAPVRAGTDIRDVIVNAIERRNTVLKGCGSDNKGLNEKEIIDLTNDAISNGFRTKAEEDAANDRAISQAMWELVQEDEKKAYGSSYIQPTPTNPTGNGGGRDNPAEKRVKTEASSSAPPKSVTTRQPPKHVSRLVAEASSSNQPRPVIKKEPNLPKMQKLQTTAPDPPPSTIITGWTCEICTLHNPGNFLLCGACETERPESVTRQLAEVERKERAASQAKRPQANTWTCRHCTTVMDNQWWTCSTCSNLKESS